MNTCYLIIWQLIVLQERLAQFYLLKQCPFVSRLQTNCMRQILQGLKVEMFYKTRQQCDINWLNIFLMPDTTQVFVINFELYLLCITSPTYLKRYTVFQVSLTIRNGLDLAVGFVCVELYLRLPFMPTFISARYLRCPSPGGLPFAVWIRCRTSS